MPMLKMFAPIASSPPSWKIERLDGDHAGHHERARPRTEEHGDEHAAEQVAGRPPRPGS